MFVFLTTRSKLRYLNYDDLRKKAANNIEEATTRKCLALVKYFYSKNDY